MSGFRLFVRIVELLTAACLVVAICMLAYRPKTHVATAGATTGPTQPVDGAKVFSENCTGCHGPDGEGGSGPALTGGAVVTKYPNAADERFVVVNGRDGMPAWSRFLTPAEIDAVVAYTRR